MTRRITATHHQIQSAVVDLIRRVGLPGLVPFHVTNEGKRSRIHGAKLKQEGLLPGFPDLGIAAPPDGRLYAMEVKAGKDGTSTDQDDVIAALRASGVPVAVVRSVDEAMTALKAWGLVRGAA